MWTKYQYSTTHRFTKPLNNIIKVLCSNKSKGMWHLIRMKHLGFGKWALGHLSTQIIMKVLTICLQTAADYRQFCSVERLTSSSSSGWALEWVMGTRGRGSLWAMCGVGPGRLRHLSGKEKWNSAKKKKTGSKRMTKAARTFLQTQDSVLHSSPVMTYCHVTSL